MPTFTLHHASDVVTDVMDVRLEYIHQLRTAAGHVEVFSGLRPELEAALARAAADREEDPVRGLVTLHITVGSALGLGLRAARVNRTYDVAIQDIAGNLYRVLVKGRLGGAHSARRRKAYAMECREQRQARAADLALLDPSIGIMLDEWIEVGDAIGTALSERSNRLADSQRTALELYNAYRSAVANLRAAIRAEVAMFDDLPRDLESLILGYADALKRRVLGGSAAEPENESQPELALVVEPALVDAPAVEPAEDVENA